MGVVSGGLDVVWVRAGAEGVRGGFGGESSNLGRHGMWGLCSYWFCGGLSGVFWVGCRGFNRRASIHYHFQRKPPCVYKRVGRAHVVGK